MVEIRDKQNKISENAFTVVFLVTENSNVPINCHNPTNNLKQLKTIFVGVVLVSVRETTPHHTGDHYNSGSYRQPRKLIMGMQHYLTPSRQNMKEDLNFIKMEDDLNFFE